MQALALKYRPRNYEELIGQESVSKTLSYALDDGRLGHAYLFSGLRGSGKTSSARIFAKALLCDQGPTSKPCEICPNCQMANDGRHIDIVEMDGASNRKIDDIRELIEQTKYAPASARFKIFIIDEVHMLTKEAFNALLKTLEEPPSYVKFILATTDPLKLPATVLSRTQHFRFKPIAKNMIVNHLENIIKKEEIPYEIEALDMIARRGSGSLRDSITLLDQAIVFSDKNITQDAIASMLGILDPQKIEEILKIIIKQDRDSAISIIKELENYDPETIIDELIANLKDKFLNRDPKFSFLMYERFLRILSEAKNMLFINSDGGFTLAMTMFLMMEAMNLKSIDKIIEKSTEQSKQSTFKPLKQEDTEKESLASNVANKPEESPYDRFLARIYDRDYDIGKCFEEDVEFVKFEENKLYLISRAEGKNQELLRRGSRAILEVLRSTFDNNTKIEIKPEKKNEARDSLKIDKDLEKLTKIQEHEEERSMDHKKKLSSLMSELQGQSSSAQESKDDRKLSELRRLFGEPSKILEN
ncbi:DNA polymerase III, gamma and tau subunits [Campylobacter blaseri]|uniref:DNA polymerase III subunit gamma/tau n=1 Tax=Campylobacter blaseri TaxID=2042961 RepID=A0A2P8R1A7_9BACT|nr:DNA polymerase III subunit gamma/tau [Campylobacter blaseri]PSM52283.1 DNA polymerase III subunit gamma/tau [Campylobacter blaseri]PSM54049.1 DNA polymerase III subunit gamma/tau [Campylobacter blaseri]QKF85490.1 DNA polymerase III, gamma and tau subunits [Campylobacter blaseri]